MILAGSVTFLFDFEYNEVTSLKGGESKCEYYMKAMPLRFEPVAMAELDELQKLCYETFHAAFAHQNTPEDINTYLNEAFNSGQLAKELSNPESKWFFARKDAMIVGYIKLNFGSAQYEFQDQKSMELQRIYVAREFQNQGFGQALLDYSITVAREAGVDFVWLGVWEKNAGARRLYERNGFVEISSHEFALGNDIQTDILMKLPL